MLQVAKTEDQLLDEEEWEIEQLTYYKNEQIEKLPYLDAQIDDLGCELGDLKSERDEIVSIAKDYQKEINKILDKREDRDYQKYLRILWYKCLITENQTTLDFFMEG